MPVWGGHSCPPTCEPSELIGDGRRAGPALIFSVHHLLSRNGCPSFAGFAKLGTTYLNDTLFIRPVPRFLRALCARGGRSNVGASVLARANAFYYSLSFRAARRRDAPRACRGTCFSRPHHEPCGADSPVRQRANQQKRCGDGRGCPTSRRLCETWESPLRSLSSWAQRGIYAT
jgi:hypothetical protein